MFVLLELEADGEAVGDDGFGELAAGDWRVFGGHGLEDVALLLGRQRVDPREKQFALAVDFLELFFGPVVIFTGADDAFHLVSGAKVGEIAFEVFFVLAAAGAFEVDDAMHARIDPADVMRATGFQQYSEVGIA